MSIFIFTDGKCSLYVDQAKFSLLVQIKHIISLCTIQNVITNLSTSFFFFDLCYDLLKVITKKSSHLHVMLSMLCFQFLEST